MGAAQTLPATEERAAAAAPAIAISTLYRFFHTGEEETLALRGVSLTVRSGELVAVVGPSGSGKSTLLSCLAGLDEPDGGSVRIRGQLMSHQPEQARAKLRASQVGMLLQSANLLEHLTVRQNVTLVQTFSGRAGGDDPSELLAQVGLTDRADAYPSALSGGEAARAGLAVAMANDPAVLLADEPTGELDTTTEARILDLLAGCAERGAAIVVASHSPAVAAAAARVIHLADGMVAA